MTTFSFYEFYNGLLTRTNYFDNYWDNYPKGELMTFKKEIISLLNTNILNNDVFGLECTLAVAFRDGIDQEYTDLLLYLASEPWHLSIEDIVEALGETKDPKTIDKLYEIAIDIPDYDEMRAIAKKCMWSLRNIGTAEAVQKIALLNKFDDWIIQENAKMHLEGIRKENNSH